MSIGIKKTEAKLKPLSILLGFLIFMCGFAGLIWSKLPIADPPSYFDFVDKRSFLGIDNTFDVISNLGFLVIAIYGFLLIRKNKKLSKEYLIMGLILSSAILLTFVGSSYFHLLPNPQRLFWDRLPMTLIFGAMISLLIMDRIDRSIGVIVASILIPLSALSAIGWHLGWFTLRPYIVLQLGSLVFVFLIALLRPKGLISNSAVWWSLGFYSLAKILEAFDIQVFELTSAVSGHSLKHLVAAVALIHFLSFLRIKSLR